jgi:pimeloyl-ACP methyl ester carboxylesterase
MTRSTLNVRIAASLVLAVTFTALTVQADVVILKDGYTLHGLKTVKEKDLIIDDSGDAFLGPKANGMTAVDDGPRWVVFPNSALQVADVSDNNKFKDFTAYTREKYRGTEKLPSTARDPQLIKDWDPKTWERVIKFNDVDPRLMHTVKQHVNFISPHYVRVGSSTHTLTLYYLLREFKADRIRMMLAGHPDLAEMPGKPEAIKRERFIRFWIQADWLDEADKDLEQLQADLPAEKDRYARLKSEVNALRAEKLMVEIERARDSGRHQWAIQALAAFPKVDVPRAVAVKAIGLQAEYEKRTALFASAQRYLDELIKKIPANNDFLVEGAKAVRNEAHLDTLSRLDMFITLAERAEKDGKEGRRPAQSPEELIASAITGWHLGKIGAETKIGTAYKCWMTRLMALEYFRTPALANRQKLLNGYLAGTNALPYDEMEKLVSLLPAPDAPEKLPTGTVNANLMPSSTFPAGAPYLLRLPDEYQPGRSYPLLIALPDPSSDKRLDEFLSRFGDLPNRHGYIIAVPQWFGPRKNKYQYSKEEQALVLELIRTLRRSFQVDSDRIYLWGNGEGASMALDLGGAHPDMFAGIVPVNPSIYQPLYIPAEYWVNFHQLPVYMIMGDKFGASVNTIRMISERWMPRGFPTLIVSYKGRAAEWFSEELPYAFDWMGRKRRADPGKMVGPPSYEGKTVAAGFSSVRLSDNRFHWLSSDDIRSERSMSPILGSSATTPAKFSAKILEGNAIEAKAFGMRELTIWFGRGMVDYSKPVRMKVNDGKSTTQKIVPKIDVLMEDLYERADRQRPYFERVDLKVPGG